MTKQLNETLAAIDAANALDPNQETVNGQPVAKELIYGQRMSQELASFTTEASVHLQIAARAQHIERWHSPRSDYPEGRSGYKKWRSQLSLFHARRAGEIMAQHGYASDDIERTQYLIQKRNLKRDDETQALEDVICLVFLRHYLDDFAAKHSEEKLIDIIQKTWKKMSEKGHQVALKIAFSEEISDLLKKSLN